MTGWGVNEGGPVTWCLGGRESVLQWTLLGSGFLMLVRRWSCQVEVGDVYWKKHLLECSCSPFLVPHVCHASSLLPGALLSPVSSPWCFDVDRTLVCSVSSSMQKANILNSAMRSMLGRLR